MADNDHILEAHDLRKTFGEEEALKGVSLRVREGDIFGLIGPSGAGKTTMIQLLIGLLRPTSGKVNVLGAPPDDFTNQQRINIGYMPQISALLPNLTVWENLNFYAAIHGMGWVRRERMKEVLEFVELYEHRGKSVEQLSGGMKRRLSLAAALIHEPELLMLDEPTAGVDPILRDHFWNHFRELQSDGRTIFVTTQYVSEAAYCDTIALLSNGHLLAAESPGELRQSAFGGELIELHTATRLSDEDLQEMTADLPVELVERKSEKAVFLKAKNASKTIPDVLHWAKNQNQEVVSIDHNVPLFDDVFVKLIKEGEVS